MKSLAEKIKQGNVILFVGAGVSATLGVPTWGELMNYLADSLRIDRDIFKMYGDPLQLAEYYKLKKGSIGQLRSWMDVNWNIEEKKIQDSSVYERILQLGIPIIYTTNFDRCIEKAFDIHKKAYIKITKVEDISRIQKDTTQIIKFHGDFDSDDSIVLTESSYFDRMDFETPLDIKLRSDILGKSLLFIGYSLSDINMRYMLYKLNKIWQGNNNSLPPKSYIFMTTPNPIQEKIWESRNIVPIVGENSNPSDSLDEFLGELCDLVRK